MGDRVEKAIAIGIVILILIILFMIPVLSKLQYKFLCEDLVIETIKENR